MEYKKFETAYVVRLDPGDEICGSLLAIAKQENITLASISGIGAVNKIDIGVFDTTNKTYHSNQFEGTFEIVSLLGTLTQMNGEPYLHAHMSVGDMQGNMLGGHLTSAVVSATAEIALHLIPGTVDREFNRRIGLNLFKFAPSQNLN